MSCKHLLYGTYARVPLYGSYVRVLQDARTTVSVFFEIVSGSKGSVDPGPSGVGQFYVQFKLTYLHADGSLRCRVFTFTRQRAPAAVSALHLPQLAIPAIWAAHCGC